MYFSLPRSCISPSPNGSLLLKSSFFLFFVVPLVVVPTSAECMNSIMMLSRFLDDAYMTILASPLNCCSSTDKQAPIRGFEKSMRIEHKQPRLVASPVFAPQERPSTRGQDWTDRTRSFASSTSSRASFSVRRNLNAYNGSHTRRPRIGKPTDFRHLDSAVVPRKVIGRFRPLELSIYTDNQLSPILPHLDDELPIPRDIYSVLPYPPTVTNHRSDSIMSFTIPRKPVRSSFRTSSEWTARFKPRPDSSSADELLAALEHQLPKLPLSARLRSLTEPPSYDRVKSALHERHQLEQKLKDIEAIIEERKSIYFSSRPVSRISCRQSIYLGRNESMTSVTPVVVQSARTAIAPLVSSFSSHVASSSTEQRPRTAPSKTVHIPSRLKSFTEASATFAVPSPSSTSAIHVSRSNQSERSLPPPPLPLILQATPPPLRKKKSFSSVSRWLSPPLSVRTREISLDSLTNTPKPITSRQGFYQCIDFRRSSRHSTDSVVSMTSTLQSTLDEPTINSTWTPGSSLRSDVEKRSVRVRTFDVDEERNESVEFNRVRTFSEKETNGMESRRMEPLLGGRLVPERNSVGVAF